MKRLLAVGSLTLLVGVIALASWFRNNRYEILAGSDLKKFADSERDELYTFYPQLIDKITEDPELAHRVVVLHLSVSDFRSPEFKGRDFSSLARLPNLTTVECTYAHNVDDLAPTLNQIETLEALRLYYCDPVEQILEQLDSDSLRSIEVHTYNTLKIPNDVTDEFVHRMPECKISFTTD